MTHRQDRTWSLVDDSFGDAAHQDVGKAGAPVGAHHNEVGGLALRRMDDLQKRRTYSHEAAHFNSAFTQTRSSVVKFLQGLEPLFLGYSVHCADIKAWIQFANHHRRQRLVHVNHDYLGGEFLRESYRIIQCELGILREICGSENFVEVWHERTIPRCHRNGKRGAFFEGSLGGGHAEKLQSYRGFQINSGFIHLR
jgi:hypothetical protein